MLTSTHLFPFEIIADVGLFRGSSKPWAPPMVIPIASLPWAATSTLTICYSLGTQAFTLGYSILRMRIMRRESDFSRSKSGCFFSLRQFFDYSSRRSWYKMYRGEAISNDRNLVSALNEVLEWFVAWFSVSVEKRLKKRLKKPLKNHIAMR